MNRSPEGRVETGFNRAEFDKNLRSYFVLYVGKVGDVDVASLIDGNIEAILIGKASQLSESESFPNPDADGILIAQDYALAVAQELKNIDGSIKEATPRDTRAMQQFLLDSANRFVLDYYDIPPTVTYAVLSEVDIEGDNTRLPNRLVKMLATKFFEHPYFQDLGDEDKRGLIRYLDVNITSPLLKKLGERPSREEMEALVDAVIERMIQEIDADVLEYNAPERLEEDERSEPARPVDIIRNHMVHDHDFLANIVQEIAKG